MHILISAGGTSEPIDSVRSITNTSTGLLASIIHKHWVEYRHETSKSITIHYVVATPAVMPMVDKDTIIYKVSDTFSVQQTVREILKNHKIDIIIHLMAISDYYVTDVRSTKDLSLSLESFIKEQMLHGKEVTADSIEAFLNQPNKGYKRGDKKISSKDDLMLSLGQTPKIISEIKSLSPESRLVGFKLLDHVSEKELVRVANEQSIKNQCEFVVANDLQYITKDQHKAIIIKDNQVIHRCETKEDIAKNIIKELTL